MSGAALIAAAAMATATEAWWAQRDREQRNDGEDSGTVSSNYSKLPAKIVSSPATVANGVAQFTNLPFQKVHTGLQLHAKSSPVLTPAASNTFDAQTDGDKLFADGFDGCVP